MRINFPYFYNVEHRREDGDVRLRPLMSTLSCDVPELSRLDVDVAARWTRRIAGESIQIECLTWQGQAYLPTVTRDGFFVTPKLLKAAEFDHGVPGLIRPVCDFYSGVVTRDDHSHYLHQWLCGNKHKFAKPKGGTILSSTEAEVAGSIQDMANRAFILEGRVWQRVSGLHCEIFKSTNPLDRISTFAAMDYSKNDGGSWARQWKSRGPHWSEEVRISLNDVRDVQFIGGERVSQQFLDLEIAQPEAFEFDARGRFLDGFVKRFLDITRGHVGKFNADLVGQWLDIQDAFKISAHRSNDIISKLEAMRDPIIGPSGIRMLEGGLEIWRMLEHILNDNDRPIHSHVSPSP